MIKRDFYDPSVLLDYLAYVHRHLLALIVLTEIETRCQDKRAYAHWVEMISEAAFWVLSTDVFTRFLFQFSWYKVS